MRQSVRVTGGSINPDGSSVDGEVFFEPSYDLIERVAVYRLPGGRWIPGIRYHVTLWSPVDHPDPGGFRSWDGTTLPQSITFAFTTTNDTAAPPTETTPPSATYCATCDGTTRRPGVGETLTTSCGSASCHGPLSSGAALGLALDSFEDLGTTALSRVAHETLEGLTSTAEHNPALFGVSMPIIDPGQPGNSYLVYKLLIDERLWDTPGSDDRFPVEPVGGSLRPDPAELARLRETFVSGDPMPPVTYGALDLGRARALLSWIGAGATPPPGDECPPVDCERSGSSGSSGQAGASP